MSRLSARHGSANTGREVAASRDERQIDIVEWLSQEIDKLAEEIDPEEPCPPDCALCNLIEDFEKGWDESTPGEGKRSGEALHGEDPEASEDLMSIKDGFATSTGLRFFRVD